MFSKKNEKRVSGVKYTEFNLDISLNETKNTKLLIIEASNSYHAYSFQDFFSNHSSITHLEILIPLDASISIHPVYQWAIDYAFVEKTAALENVGKIGFDVLNDSYEFISGHFIQKDPYNLSKCVFKILQPFAPLVVNRTEGMNKLLIFQHRYYNQKCISSSQFKLELNCYFIGRFKNDNKIQLKEKNRSKNLMTIETYNRNQIEVQEIFNKNFKEIDEKISQQETKWKDELSFHKEEIDNQEKIIREQSILISKLHQILDDKEQKLLNVELRQIDQDNKIDSLENQINELQRVFAGYRFESTDDLIHCKEKSINSIEKINHLTQSQENMDFSKLSRSLVYETKDDELSTMSRISDRKVKTVSISLVSENSFSDLESFMGSKESKEDEKKLIETNNRLLSRNKELTQKTINLGRKPTVNQESSKKFKEMISQNQKNDEKKQKSKNINPIKSLKDPRPASMSLNAKIVFKNHS